MPSPSHVFVVRGDLMQLTCDAWCVPGGSGGPGSTWRPALPHKKDRIPVEVGWCDDGKPRSRLLAEAAPPEPLPFLTNITGSHRDTPAFYVDGARDFVRIASKTLRERARPPVFGRARHLLALPLVGTGYGGGALVAGDVLRLLLPALSAEANEAGMDVALVLFDGPAWAAAQNERLMPTASSASPNPFTSLWAALSPKQAQVADDLATKAKNGDLVMFLGAGVSQGAGLPSWNAMLETLAQDRAGVADFEKDALSRLGELDRAALIQRRLKDRETLGDAVASLLREKAKRHSLAHALLASLPVEEAITTNYDDLFERASSALERPVVVLPGGQVARGQRWLLKMHGTVTRPESIVLTREDYLKFQENRTALAGIVQALLLTRHMLFVGFSFTDDNFHRIAHAVRQNIATTTKFGTTLVVAPNPLAEELWGEQLDWITFDGTLAEQARLLDVFLDRLAATSAASTAHLGDRRYDGVLSEGEKALRDRMVAMSRTATPAEKATAAWGEVERLLARLGIRT